MDLGLTSTSARVYLTLVKYEALELLTLAEMAKIARPDTYRILKKLQKLGLIEKILEKPTKYRAIPKKEALSLLLEAKTEKFREVTKETQFLINIVDTEKANNEDLIKNPQFVLIPQGKRLLNTIRTTIEKVQFNIDNVLSWERFSQGVLNRFAESMEKAHAKNVEMRFIVGEPPERKTAKDVIQFCREKLGCRIRFLSNQPKTDFAIYDKKEILIVAISKTDFRSSPALWSNSNALIALGLDHFEELWQKAKEY